MIQKWISSVMAGVFISMGAMVYLSIPNALVGSLFFATGILLVLNLHNMLYTRICPLMIYDGQYRWTDAVIGWIGNGIGAFVAAAAVSFTRIGAVLGEGVKTIGEAKLADSPISLFIMGVFCAFLVASAVLVGAKQKQGSFGQIFCVWLFITAFVFCGFEHIVADMFYISLYALYYGAQAMDVVKLFAFVTAGNTVGGLFIAWAVRESDKNR